MNSTETMKMKFSPLVRAGLVLMLLSGATQVLAIDDIPKRVPFDRYSGMMNKSPFAVATAVVTAAPTPNFAKDLYVANAARLADGDMVTVQSATDRNMKEYLTTNAPNEHGYAITSIEWSDKPAQTKVTISKDGQFATIGFNQALMAQSPAQPAMPQPPGGNMVPGQPRFPVPNYAPPRPALPVPAMPTPPPHTRGPIQRNPSAGAQKPNLSYIVHH